MLGDIAREAATVEREVTRGVGGGGAGLDRLLFHSLKQKLALQVSSRPLVPYLLAAGQPVQSAERGPHGAEVGGAQHPERDEGAAPGRDGAAGGPGGEQPGPGAETEQEVPGAGRQAGVGRLCHRAAAGGQRPAD